MAESSINDKVPGYWGDFSKRNLAKNMGIGFGAGAVIGGASGTVVPGVGTVIGAGVGGVVGAGIAALNEVKEAFDTDEFAKAPLGQKWLSFYDNDEATVKFFVPALAKEIQEKQEQVKEAEYNSMRAARVGEKTSGNIDAVLADLRDKDPVLANRVAFTVDNIGTLKPTDTQLMYVLEYVLGKEADKGKVLNDWFNTYRSGIVGNRSIEYLKSSLKNNVADITDPQKEQIIKLITDLTKLDKWNNDSIYDVRKQRTGDAKDSKLAEYILSKFDITDKEQINTLANSLWEPATAHKALNEILGGDQSKIDQSISLIEKVTDLTIAYNEKGRYVGDLEEEKKNLDIITPEIHQEILSQTKSPDYKELMENKIPLTIPEAYKILEERQSKEEISTSPPETEKTKETAGETPAETVKKDKDEGGFGRI